MSWPKHKYAWIGGFGGPIRDMGNGNFNESGFAEVFLDRAAARWVRDQERKSFASLAKTAPTVPPEDARNTATKRDWLRRYATVRIIRIALPGTYAQFKAPGRLERQLAREARA
jgi:hypothetical protein